MMTIPQQIKDLDHTWFQKQLFQIKLFFRLFGKSGCLFQVSYIFFSLSGVLVYIIAPDMVPGALDDVFVAPWLIPWVLSKAWIAFLPNWFVEKHRLALEKELKAKPNTNAPVTKEAVTAQTSGPIVVIHHTNDEQSSVFHFTQTVVSLIKENRKLRHKLCRLGELKDANLVVDRIKEGEVITTLSVEVKGLQIRYSTK